MYLSRLVLDPQTRAVLLNLADPYQLHRMVMSGFPPTLPSDERVLFRLETQRSDPPLFLLVQSRCQPDWSGLERRRCLLRPAEVKTLELHPAVGDTFHFRLLANPTKRLGAKDPAAGKRVGLLREEEQTDWLQRKAQRHGFRLLDFQTAAVRQPDGWKEEGGKKHRLRQVGVRFDGLLEVLDAPAFMAAWSSGIGSGKGLGFGLLSLARAG
jgi:CRISPR system Cascade subunit CasE